jgi:amino acid adenylation domain-containing protein
MPDLSVPFAGLISRLLDAAREHEDRIALVYGDESLTYGALLQRMDALAGALIERKAGPGKTVGVCLERSIDMVVSVLAVLRAGSTYVPLDPGYPEPRLRDMIGDAGIAALITRDALRARLPIPADIAVVTPDTTAKLHDALPLRGPSDLAYVIFTSGSTGRPKGVVLGDAALDNLITWQLKDSRLGVGARTLQFAPISFDVHFQEIFSTFLSGGTLVLIPEKLRTDPLALLREIRERNVERVFLPFVALQSLCEMAASHQLFPSSLKEVVTAGEQLRITPQIAAFFTALPRCTLANHYGPSETHVVTALTLSGPPGAWPALPSIGRPLPYCGVHILDEQRRPVEAGTEGELWISGICLARGYMNRPDLTAERFVELPGIGRAYRTGDLARLAATGEIEYRGRTDGQVKIRGFRVETGEVEVALSRAAFVKQAAVVAREDVPGQTRLVAYVVLNAQQTVPPATALRELLVQNLPEYMVPQSFVVMDDMPRTPSGKIDRRALPAPARSRPPLGEPFVAAADGVEEVLSQLFQQVLGFDEALGANDNFFDLGGTSLTAVQAVARAKLQHGLDIPVVQFFEHPTARSLARYLSGETRTLARRRRDTIDQAEPVAIVGMAARFPGADDVDDFWRNLIDGVDSIRHFAPHELDPKLPESVTSDPRYVPARGVIDGIDRFDPAFFGIAPYEAELIDPQQRLLLELSVHALEHAGHAPHTFRTDETVGVFAGTHNNSYYLRNVRENHGVMERVGELSAMVANEKDYVASRIAHRLSLTGPAIDIQTACSTSLVAVVQAFHALRNNSCDYALAGAAALTVPTNSGHIYQEGSALSADGHCRPFSRNATGTTFSDGAGMVVLRRLSDAQRDGDTIYAVIKGGAVNNDGGNRSSFTAPSISGQAAVILAAQESAGIPARSIGYVEAHGTATPLGDPIEVEALRQAFSQSTADSRFCGIGSVKSNIGHTTAASGVAGLIKTALALHHERIPPTLHFDEPNPAIDFARTPFFVEAAGREWKRGPEVRRAAVSSFGFGGTNAHVILEEAPPQLPAPSQDDAELLVFSARTRDSLAQGAAAVLGALGASDTSLGDAAFTLQIGRREYSERGFAVVRRKDELNDKKLVVSGTTAARPRGAVFMFPGQGAQYVGMGRALHQREPVFRSIFDQANEILTPRLGRSLKEIVFAEEGESAQRALQETTFTQSGLFALEYALALQWMHWGINPTALIGHSVGEFVAATIAGVFSLEDALTLIATRGQLMQALPPGVMLSVRLPSASVAPRLRRGTAIASVNSPDLCVVAGPAQDIDVLRMDLEREGAATKVLVTSHAFHSPMMEPAVAPFLDAIRRVKLQVPRLPILSTVTATWLSDELAGDPRYWARHMIETVRFSDALVAVMKERPGAALLEVGPRATLATIARQHMARRSRDNAADERPVVASLSNSADAEWAGALNALGQLWIAGEPVDWRAFQGVDGQRHNVQRRRAALPGYSFERRSFWIEPAGEPAVSTHAISSADHSPVIAQKEPIVSDRKPELSAALAKLIEDASGFDLSNASPDDTFFELGIDSLLLTQIALAVSREFRLDVSFRRLSEELSSLSALVDHLDRNLPKAQPAPPAPATSAKPAREATDVEVGLVQATTQLVSPGERVPANATQALIAEQLRLMQQQLAVLAGGGLVAPFQPEAQVVQPRREGLSAPSPQQVQSEEGVANGPVTYDVKKAFGAIARINTARADEMTPKQRARFDALKNRYNARTRRSKDYTQEHRPHLADPRVVTGFRPALKEVIYQIVINKSEGCRLWDIDGNEYIDALNGFGSNFFGNRPQFVTTALQKQLEAGYELGPQHELAGEVARLFCELTGLERAGLCNTGSEAVMGAMRMARTVTGRNLIAIFSGSYHGIFDEVLVRGTKKLRSIPAAPGILPESVANVLVLDYGTDESLEILRRRGHELAAIMVEPVQSRRPDFQPREFLHSCRKICDESGAAMIFDEVITGFRTGPQGAQGFFGVRADIATYGKVVGGGMPIGIIGGCKRFMDALDGGFWRFGDDSIPTTGVTYFAGTFVRHPFALAAAKAVLLELKEKGPALQEAVTATTERFATELNHFFKEVGAPIKIKHFASLWKIFYSEDQVYGDLLFIFLRDKGIHIWDGFPCFMTTAHSEADVRQMVKAIRESVAEMQEAGFLPEAPGKSGLAFDASKPPVPGARLGRDPNGNPAWFAPNPQDPGKYVQVHSA